MGIDGRFLLIKRIGQGGFGTVWAATDVDTGEQVAIKFVHPEHRSNTDVMERFEIEAEALGRLEHPGIARALGWRGHKTLAYLAMEYLRGQTLSQVIRTFARDERPISEQTAIQVFRQIAEALDHAHSKQILHRDLKPSNVMVTQRGDALVLKLMDFGLAKILDGTRPPTTVGRTMGTFFYMAPEQVMHEPADPRTDVFALGVTMFELLTFHRAWAVGANGRPSSLLEDALKLEANGPNKLLRRIVTASPPRLRSLRKDVSPWLAGIVEMAMAPSRSDRFPSAAAVLAALDSPTVLSPLIRPAMTSGAIEREAERPRPSQSFEEPVSVLTGGAWPPPAADTIQDTPLEELMANLSDPWVEAPAPAPDKPRLRVSLVRRPGGPIAIAFAVWTPDQSGRPTFEVELERRAAAPLASALDEGRRIQLTGEAPPQAPEGKGPIFTRRPLSSPDDAILVELVSVLGAPTGIELRLDRRGHPRAGMSSPWAGRLAMALRSAEARAAELVSDRSGTTLFREQLAEIELESFEPAAPRAAPALLTSPLPRAAIEALEENARAAEPASGLVLLVSTWKPRTRPGLLFWRRPQAPLVRLSGRWLDRSLDLALALPAVAATARWLAIAVERGLAFEADHPTDDVAAASSTNFDASVHGVSHPSLDAFRRGADPIFVGHFVEKPTAFSSRAAMGPSFNVQLILRGASAQEELCCRARTAEATRLGAGLRSALAALEAHERLVREGAIVMTREVREPAGEFPLEVLVTPAEAALEYLRRYGAPR
jgi:serine/threonine protein kinase